MAEVIESYFNLEEKDQKLVVAAHVIAFKTKKKSTMQRIFELGNPKIVMGDNNGKRYCRIHADDIEVMKVLIKQYL